MNSYDRIASLLRFLDEHRRDQPDLDALAAHVGMSRFHVHRLFAAWAGITPKDFLQCLTLEHAKGLLRAGESVLDAALDAGLSGPGRLHDLCVSLEAATPGEVKSRGDGLEVAAGVASTPLGDCVVGQTARGVCALEFVDAPDGARVEAIVRAEWPRARVRRDDGAARRVAQAAFAPRGARAPASSLRAFVRGTEFQVRVWRALLRVERGALTSYARLARAIGQPSAARAVGSAVGSNPIAVLIPCHRVIRETGAVGEYRWGRERKQALLAWETAPRASSAALAGGRERAGRSA